jgi:hypothetical protein
VYRPRFARATPLAAIVDSTGCASSAKSYSPATVERLSRAAVMFEFDAIGAEVRHTKISPATNVPAPQVTVSPVSAMSMAPLEGTASRGP